MFYFRRFGQLIFYFFNQVGYDILVSEYTFQRSLTILRKFFLCFTVLPLSTQIFAEECAKLSYKYCAMNDVPSGSTRIEYDVSDCSQLVIRRIHTDYKCTTEGELLSSSVHLVSGEWLASTRVTTQKDNDLEYGIYKFKDKLFWNSDRTELNRIHEEENELKSLDILAGKYFKKSETRVQSQKITRERNEVVVHKNLTESYKSKFSRNEWLKRSEETIEVFEPLN